ncbi:MAG TPA: extracellular solute-binding protein, partial [Acidimicrobiales bacterium]|nr:extracellular solute-binding protein [Acidimicrobiales bacterium]
MPGTATIRSEGRPRAAQRRGPGPRSVAALAALAGAVVLAACGSGPLRGAGAQPAQATGAAAKTLTLYNAQHEQTTDALVAAFTKATGITVRVKNDDEDDLVAEIEAEGSRSPADVIYTENSNWLQQLDDRGLLA